MTHGNIPDSLPLCPGDLAAESAMKTADRYGLQIREDRFDSDTRLHLFNDLAGTGSTNLPRENGVAAFPFWSRSVLRCGATLKMT